MQALVRLPDGTGQTLKVEGMKDACRQAWLIGAKSLVCMDEETWTFTERRERPRTFSAGMDSSGSEAALQSPYPYLLMA